MKKYINPEMNISMFLHEDICTASGALETQAVDAETLKASGNVVELSFESIDFTF